MDVPEVLDIAKDAVWVLLTTIAPIMGLGLTVGLSIALFQSLTQIQEMTLVFVPKILTVFLSLLLFMPYMINNLIGLMKRMAARIADLQ
jgi:flagellar biosynthetic protein FliQ